MRAVLDAVAAAEERLDTTVAAMTDEQAAAPSLLPGWTRAMLVTHLARNAESNAETVAAALLGEHRPQYPGGPGERVAQIEAGRGRSAAEVLADLRASAVRWADVMGSVGDADWTLEVPANVGPRSVAQRVRARLFEVEVHHADLGLGYRPSDWPAAFVDETLERAVTGIAARRTPAARRGRWGVAGRVVDVGDDVTVASGDADGAVGGAPSALLAWLLGRAGAGALMVTGDRAVADLPSWFPFP